MLLDRYHGVAGNAPATQDWETRVVGFIALREHRQPHGVSDGVVAGHGVVEQDHDAVAHAVIHQNLGGQKLPFAAHEYLAYAVQLSTLSAPNRERILARFPGAAFTELEQVSEIVLGLDPDRFAVKAYQHFRKLDDQDAVLRRLLADFPAHQKEWY